MSGLRVIKKLCIMFGAEPVYIRFGNVVRDTLCKPIFTDFYKVTNNLISASLDIWYSKKNKLQEKVVLFLYFVENIILTYKNRAVFF